MKKTLCILLTALLLCGAFGAGLNAAAAPPKAQALAPAAVSPLLGPLVEFLAQYDLKSLTDAQVNILIGILKTLKTLGIDYTGILEAVDDLLPMAVKAALHDAGLMNYPIWERDFIAYLIFRYLLFGWYWM